jgi:putative transposase
MARQPRLTAPGYPHHVIVRGNNRQPIFLSVADRQKWLELMAQFAQEQKVALHSYVLMDNHVHLLLTPQTDKGLPKMMQQLGRTYVRYFNQLHSRSGTLFEGRYKSTIIQTERYLLVCMAYIDLNPVRAGLCAQPQDYAWSSYGHYAGLRTDPLIGPHPHIWNLGNTPFAREAAYIAFVQAGLKQADEQAITESAIKAWALGDEGFTKLLGQKTQRRLAPGQRGRPLKSPSA